MSGNKINYKYYCQTELKWIEEEKELNDAPPTQCKNDASHTFVANSLHIDGYKDYIYCNIKPMSGTTNENTSGLNTETISLVELARRVMVIEQCGLSKGLLRQK